MLNTRKNITVLCVTQFTDNWVRFFGFARRKPLVLLDFSLTVKAATLIFISGYGSAVSSAKEGKSGFIYNLVKSKQAF